MGRDSDWQLISTIREVTQKPIRGDINSGWTDKGQALIMNDRLATQNVQFVEPAVPKGRIGDYA
jgi:L-alanine-DL-glutamate epimerase-like enolase superfamily enzyme